MRIAIGTGVPKGLDFYAPTHRGESRWVANWRRILEEAGHEISNDRPDLVLGVSWEVGNIDYKNVPHAHLRFGLPTKGLVDKYLRCWGPNCRIASPYNNLTDDPDLKERHIFLPFPYSDKWLPEEMAPPVERKELTWAVKSIWYERCRRERPYIAQCGIWTLEALAELLPGNGFTFNVIQCAEGGSSFSGAPNEAQQALNRIPGVKKIEGNRNFSEFVAFMSRSRVSFSVGGFTGGILEAVFTGCVPLAHKGVVFGAAADAKGYNLPFAWTTTKEDIVEKLEKLLLMLSIT
jgi:hypothetical protein